MARRRELAEDSFLELALVYFSIHFGIIRAYGTWASVQNNIFEHLERDSV